MALIIEVDESPLSSSSGCVVTVDSCLQGSRLSTSNELTIITSDSMQHRSRVAVTKGPLQSSPFPPELLLRGFFWPVDEDLLAVHRA